LRVRLQDHCLSDGTIGHACSMHERPPAASSAAALRLRRRELIAGGCLALVFAPATAQQPGAARPDVAHTGSVREIDVPRYDADYPAIDYSAPATQNRIARLQEQLARGGTRLEWRLSGGFLDALLSQLQIDADTQVLVFSRTSLQPELISPQTPRAVFFNDDTYVGFIPGSAHIELMGFDAQRGPVFYTLHNAPEAGGLRRFGGACLTCHDNYSLMGGGVPRVLGLSLPVEVPGVVPTSLLGIDVDDRTPIRDRWGGWYVTGRTGIDGHRGNRPVAEGGDQQLLVGMGAADRDSLAGVFDTSRYPTPHSDVAALLVLEHQKTVQNLLVRVGLKATSSMQRLAMARGALADGPAALAARQQALLHSMVGPLLDALFGVGAAPLPQGLAAGNGFAQRFSRLGPHDRAGRSLRELDLKGRLFRLPLSYLVHSQAFDALPAVVREALRAGIRDVLRGADAARSSHIAAAERDAVARLLADTRPGFMD
jgi:hypothetical protein